MATALFHILILFIVPLEAVFFSPISGLAISAERKNFDKEIYNVDDDSCKKL